MGENTVEIDYHKRFWFVAVQNLKQVLEVISCRESIPKPIETDAQIDALCECNAKIDKLSLVSIIFSSLTAEAYINHYAIDRLSLSYLENYLDRLGPVAKWLVIPRLVTGKQIVRDCQALRAYRELVKLRNRLIHWKTLKRKVSELREQDAWTTEEQAESAVAAVRGLLLELQRVDPTVDIRWLDEAPDDPYV